MHSEHGHPDRELGQPDPLRRRLLAAGGLAVAGAAALTACGPSGGGVIHTGEQPVTSSTMLPPEPPKTSEALTERQTDQSVLQTATSLELLLVSFYGDVVSNGWIKDAAAIDAIKLFSDQHGQHAGALQKATAAAGAKPYGEPNAVLRQTLVEPSVKALQDPARKATDSDWIRFCQTLEDVAAATYVAGVGQLGTPELRQAAIAIGAVEARHHVIFANLLAPGDPSKWVPGATQSIADAVGSAATIGGKPA